MQEGSISWASGSESAAGVGERESKRAMGVALLTARLNSSYIIILEKNFFIEYAVHFLHTHTSMPHLCIPVHPAANSAAMLRMLVEATVGHLLLKLFRSDKRLYNGIHFFIFINRQYITCQ